MKTVYLFRHGDAEDNNPGGDYNRELTEKGRKYSAQLGSHLNETGTTIDIIISSGAPRARVTAEVAAGEMGYNTEDIVIDDMLYSSGNPEDILALLLSLSPEISSLMIVGHNPLLSDFVMYICSSCYGLSMKKSSIVKIEFDLADWGSIGYRSGKLVYYKVSSKSGVENSME
jgi:phosphohistidine phosphatase